MKTEVQRVKKKLQVQITELELSLDVANKNNIDLQKTIKKQSLTLTVSKICIFVDALIEYFRFSWSSATRHDKKLKKKKEIDCHQQRII